MPAMHGRTWRFEGTTKLAKNLVIRGPDADILSTKRDQNAEISKALVLSSLKPTLVNIILTFLMVNTFSQCNTSVIV